MLGTNFIGNISGIYRAAPVSPPFDRTWYANNVDQVNIRPASDRSLLLCFGDEISFDAHLAVARLTRSLAGVRGILNLHPAYTSVLVDFDPRLRSHAQVEALVRERLASQGQEAAPESRHVEIPVRYGGEFGPDLGDVARHTGLSEERVVELHSAAEYLVYFVGFSTCSPIISPPTGCREIAANAGLFPPGRGALGIEAARFHRVCLRCGCHLAARTPWFAYWRPCWAGDCRQFWRPTLPSTTPPMATRSMLLLVLKRPTSSLVLGFVSARPLQKRSRIFLAAQ